MITLLQVKSLVCILLNVHVLSVTVRASIFCCEGTLELMVNWWDKFHKFLNIGKFLAIDRSPTKVLCSKGQPAKIKRCTTLSHVHDLLCLYFIVKILEPKLIWAILIKRHPHYLSKGDFLL